ncbi:hypothetical protein TNCV_1009081 [Trichonephila clavipes]|nr:hypothetical protein TNCV_1009081 [Trichonephila clavipes]
MQLVHVHRQVNLYLCPCSRLASPAHLLDCWGISLRQLYEEQTGIHYRRKTDFFPEEDTTKSHSGFEPEPTRLQTEGHSHHTGWATIHQ